MSKRIEAWTKLLCFSLDFFPRKASNPVVRKTQEGRGKGALSAVLWFPDISMMRTGVKSEPERYYLFAGMGGRASRRKHKIILQWSLVAGVLVSAIVAGMLYLISR
jgi:hypothetical protein